MSTEEIKENDPELIAHLEVNLNNHVWVHKDGNEQSIYTMERSQVVNIYNDLLTGRHSVLFQDKWLLSLQAAMTPVT